MPFPSQGADGRGTVLDIGQGLSGPTDDTYDQIAEQVEIGDIYPGVTEMDDRTNQDTPGGTTDFRPGITRNGPITLSCNFIPDHPTHDGITGFRKAQRDRILTNFRLRWGPPHVGEALVFQAFIVSAPVSGGIEGGMRVQLTLQQVGLETEITVP